jgi:hypothetical protein
VIGSRYKPRHAADPAARERAAGRSRGDAGSGSRPSPATASQLRPRLARAKRTRAGYGHDPADSPGPSEHKPTTATIRLTRPRPANMSRLRPRSGWPRAKRTRAGHGCGPVDSPGQALRAFSARSATRLWPAPARPPASTRPGGHEDRRARHRASHLCPRRCPCRGGQGATHYVHHSAMAVMPNVQLERSSRWRPQLLDARDYRSLRTLF